VTIIRERQSGLGKLLHGESLAANVHVRTFYNVLGMLSYKMGMYIKEHGSAKLRERGSVLHLQSCCANSFVLLNASRFAIRKSHFQLQVRSRIC
jgi:hypothetical protein